MRAEMGLKLGEFDREKQAFGLATPQGVVPTAQHQAESCSRGRELRIQLPQ